MPHLTRPDIYICWITFVPPTENFQMCEKLARRFIVIFGSFIEVARHVKITINICDPWWQKTTFSLLVFEIQFFSTLKGNIIQFIAVCIYCLVMLSIDLSETAHFAYWKSEITSETNYFFLTIFFRQFFFPTKNLFLGFCLGLYFVSHYISYAII